MTDPAHALQVALVARLKEIATECGSRVYDTIPRSPLGVTAEFPFISIGPGDAVPIDETCDDRTESTHQIDVWSRAVGFPEAKRIAGAIRAALHEKDEFFSVAGHVVDRIRVLSTNYSRDPDGLTNRARMSVQTETTAR